jgi:pimeloyl-ACP methyl ester carboxylesterase
MPSPRFRVRKIIGGLCHVERGRAFSPGRLGRCGRSGFARAARAQSTPAASARRTFVLIHGAWHGGWAWRRVADRLEAKGHYVLAPTLTGLADRSHLLNKSVDLDMHIADIVNLFEWDDLTNVTLVAHSYGGWPVSGAMEHLVPRVSSLVYLDAFFPDDGQAGTDVQLPEFAKALDAAMARGDIARPVPPIGASRIRNPQDKIWAQSKLTPQPIGVALQRIKLTNAREQVQTKTYIRASDSPSPFFDKYCADAKAKPDWRTHMVDSSHEVMIDAPDRLTTLLLQAV